MKYPDGSPINVGDLVWWNEGSCVGYVQVIAESEAEYVGWGLDSPHVFLSNIHPFAPGSNIGVAYPEACLKDEGVAPLIGEDRIRLDRASHRATSLLAATFDYTHYSVATEVKDRQLVGWVFTFWKNDEALQTISTR